MHREGGILSRQEFPKNHASCAGLDKLSSNHPPETVIQVVDFGMLVGNSWRLLPVVGVTAAETARRADPR